MNIDLLRRFLVLADDLHFGRAASRSGISQPKLSADIRKLEREVGASLFARTSRRTALTAAGMAFAEAARRTLAELERGIASARWKATGAQEAIVVAHVSTAMLMGLPAIVKAFLARNPGARLMLRELSTVPQLELLAEGAIDVAITSTIGRQRNLVCHGRWRDPLVAAVPEDWAVGGAARRGALTLPLKDLRAAPFVLFPEAHAPDQHAEIRAACARAGFAPRIVQEADGWHAVLSLVAAGMGVTIAPSVVRRLNVPGVRSYALAGPRPATSLTLCTRRGTLSESVRSFIELAAFQ